MDGTPHKSRYRKISTSIWNDRKFRALSDDGQLAFLFILTHPFMTAVGGMRASLSGLAEEKKWPRTRFVKAFHEASSQGMVKIDEEACCLILPNFMDHNGPDNPNVVKSWPKAFELIPECALKAELFQILSSFIEELTEPFQKGFERVRQTLSKGLGEPFPKGLANPSQRVRGTLPEGFGNTGTGTGTGAGTEAGTGSPLTPQGEGGGSENSLATLEWLQERFAQIPGVRPTLHLTGACLQSVNARLREHPKRDWWERLFTDMVEPSDFLCGRVNEFQASLVWICGPKNISKVQAGQYLEKRSKGKNWESTVAEAKRLMDGGGHA